MWVAFQLALRQPDVHRQSSPALQKVTTTLLVRLQPTVPETSMMLVTDISINSDIPDVTHTPNNLDLFICGQLTPPTCPKLGETIPACELLILTFLKQTLASGRTHYAHLKSEASQVSSYDGHYVISRLLKSASNFTFTRTLSVLL